MPHVALRSLLRDLAGGLSEHEVQGATVADVIAELERDHPRLAGWIVDERGEIRAHVSIFVNDRRAGLGDRVAASDRVHIIPAISGGTSVEDVELLVGTRKGLFVLRGPRGGPIHKVVRVFAGQVVEYATRDARTGTYYASVTHGQYGPHLFYTQDPLGEWHESNGPAFPADTGAAVDRIWVVQPGERDGVVHAGVAPAALFESDDGGRSWALNRPLWDEPTRPQWQGGAGGLCLHSICPWPGEPDRLALGISAAGVWLTDDGGKSWRRGVHGLVPRYLPEEARAGASDLCVHKVQRVPVHPERLYLQFHGGVYRSDDGGETWVDIGSDGRLPSDFGFPLVVDPRDPDRAFVIPLVSDEDRVTPGGSVRVFETRDRGASWEARGDGLPRRDAYLTVLRQAFCHDGCDPLGLYFGAESGEVFGSADGGTTWFTVAEHLAPVASVQASVVA